MVFLKWYSTIILTVCFLIVTINSLMKNDVKERIINFISLIFYIPIIIYLILS